jgi:hypothetical protein
MTDKEKKPPVWAYADEWPGMSDVEQAARLQFLCGVVGGSEGQIVLKSYPLPPQVGDIIQYASDHWQIGVVTEIDGDLMRVFRPGIPGTIESSELQKPIANAVKVVGRRGVEPRRTT